MQETNLRLQNEYLPLVTEQLKQRHTTFIIGALLGIVASTIPILVDRYISNTSEPIQVKILSYPKVYDTTKIDLIYNLPDTFVVKSVSQKNK